MSSPVFDVPEYMRKPQVYTIHGHYIRIWRTKLEPLGTKSEWSTYCAGLMEWTSLTNKVVLGLTWYYSLNRETYWEEYKYILESHYPGRQPCKDLPDVYRSTTAEIKWQVKRLGELYSKKKGAE
jgi:hypothetical protein